MAGSSSNQLARLLKRNKCQWPESEKSTGRYYRTMGRDTYWEAVGTARETFTRIGDEFRSYLEKNSDPVSRTVTWSMYMIGRTKETAEPTIMFCCTDLSCRKRVMKTIEDSGILKNYPGVRVGHSSKPPDFDQLVRLAAETLDSPPLDAGQPMDGVDIYSDLSTKACGARLYLKAFASNTAFEQKATAGGIVRWGNKYFFLTVAHAFIGCAETFPPDESDCDFEFDIGQSGWEDEDDFIESTSMGSISPEPDMYASSNSSEIAFEASASLSSDSQGSPYQRSSTGTEDMIAPVHGASDSNPVEPTTRDSCLEVVGHLAKLPPLGVHFDLDYALIEISNPQFYTFNCIPLEDGAEQPFLYSERVARIKQENTSILAVTGSTGLIKGALSGTPTFMKTPSSSTIQELWTVQLRGELATGDCGSWVVDSKNGDLLGHIVAGSPATGVAYIIPAYEIFEDLKQRFGEEIRLPVRDESTTDPADVPALTSQILSLHGAISSSTHDLTERGEARRKKDVNSDSAYYSERTDGRVCYYPLYILSMV
jgi:hypothetical protein